MKYRILALLDRLTLHKLWFICGRCWDYEHSAANDMPNEMTEEDWASLFAYLESQGVK